MPSSPTSATRVVFFAPPGLTSLDLFGPLQAFQLARDVYGCPYKIEICAIGKTLRIEGDFQFSHLVPYKRIKLGPGDILVVTGSSRWALTSPQFLRENRPLFEWIRRSWQAGATICSICTGAYMLAEAGVLDGSPCATHWNDIDDLQRRYPKIEVRRGILFVEAGNVFTSAGIASGIDLAIHLLGLRHGPKLAFEVSRFLVVHLRRSGDFQQESVYLQYRNHLDDVVHRAQNILIENLDRPPRADDLAAQVGSSARNLARRFQQSLGLTIGAYQRELRLEHAHALLREDGSKVADVARACGFSGPRQLRNLYQQRFGRSPRNRGRRAVRRS